MKDVAPSLALLDQAIEQYKPVAVLGLFSGGHDSLTAVSIAAKHPRFTAAVHINTGVGIEKTREFVRQTCKEQGWPLEEYFAVACGQIYRDLVLEQGFPGATKIGHGKMYNRLKERPLRKCIAKHKKKTRDKVLLVSGCRSEESTRRMGSTEPLQLDGAKIWCAIIHDWKKTDCNEYIDAAGLKRNEVVDLIHKSGECLCGAFAKPGELKELALWFPGMAQAIKDLEKEVQAAGFPWGWEDRAPEWFLEQRKGQKMMFPMEPPMMCQSCDKRHEEERGAGKTFKETFLKSYEAKRKEQEDQRS